MVSYKSISGLLIDYFDTKVILCFLLATKISGGVVSPGRTLEGVQIDLPEIPQLYFGGI